MPRLLLVLLFTVGLSLIACGKDSTVEPPLDDYNPNGHWGEPYFLNELFRNMYGPAISGDGKTFFVADTSRHMYYSILTDHGWSALVDLPFQGSDPCISYDGRTLYFSDQGMIYKSTRQGDTWGQPVYVTDGEQPSLTRDGGTMLYSAMTNPRSIEYAQLDGSGRGAITVVNALGSVSQPGISGDGTMLFFVRATQDGYNICCCRKNAEGWQAPSVLEAAINSDYENTSPCVSWDKRVLYYGTFGPGPSPHGIWVSNWVNE
jgi:Tol biopolymer transport system component